MNLSGSMKCKIFTLKIEKLLKQMKSRHTYTISFRIPITIVCYLEVSIHIEKLQQIPNDGINDG